MDILKIMKQCPKYGTSFGCWEDSSVWNRIWIRWKYLGRLNDTSFVDIDSLEEDGIEYLAGYIITYRKYLTMEICRTARKN